MNVHFDITVQKDLRIYMIEPMFTYKASHLIYIYNKVSSVAGRFKYLHKQIKSICLPVTLDLADFCEWWRIPFTLDI